MDYVIKNHKNVFIRLNENGKAVTCLEYDKTLFDYTKAKNVLNSLPKTLKKLNFKIEAIPEIEKPKQIVVEKKEKKVIQSKNYIPSENVTRWIEKFRLCDDIITEAKGRKEELCVSLSNCDKELSNELHKIELESNKNACAGFLEYKKVKTILEKRRNIKDELMIISNILSMDFRSFDSEDVKKSIEGLSKRKFTLRVVEECDDVV